MKRSNGELRGVARQALLGHCQAPMFAMLLAAFIPALFLLPFNYLCSERNTVIMQAVIFYLAYFIITLIELLLNCGVKRIHLLIARGQEVRASDMFWVLKNRPDRILIGGFVYTLIAWIPLIPSFLFQAFTPDGYSQISVLAISEFLTLAGQLIGFLITLPLYLIFWIYVDDPDINTREAFARSISLMRGAKWQLCLMTLSFAGWLALGALSFGIGFLWILPYIDQAFTNFYLELV